MLGQWFGRRYFHLIPDGKYSPKFVFVQSTDMDRTLMSALSNLAGMFPPSNDQQWSQLPWQPIPVHTTPRVLDKVSIILTYIYNFFYILLIFRVCNLLLLNTKKLEVLAYIRSFYYKETTS